MKSGLPPVYPITDKEISGRRSHYVILKELIRGGARLVQIRDKHTPTGELLYDLQRSVELAERHGILLVVNDRCDLALMTGASGVHLGQDDLPPEAARRLLGPKRLLGWSTHNPAQVRRAADMPVDYIGFGPVYPSSTKLDISPVTGLERLRAVCRRSRRPVVAIGGIGPDRIRDVLEAGAASVAVVSAVMEARSIARAMEDLLARATATGSTASRTGRSRAPGRARR